MQRFQFLHLFLEDPDVIHERYDAVGCHGRRVKSGRCEERCDVKRHGTLRRVQDEELAPAESEQRYLVSELEIREEGNVSGPLDRAEEKPRCQFANVFDTHDLVGLHALSVARGRVRLGA